MLACVQAALRYGTKSVLSSVTMTVEPGECVCVVGSGGSGKTAMLKLLLGLEHPTSGKIEIDGVDLRIVPPKVLQLYRSRTGFITQEPRMLTGMTVAENIAYPLEITGAPDKTIIKKTADMLGILELGSKAGALSDELSLSERALCCIGRAVAADPMIVLADEPLAPLDGDQADIALGLLKGAHERGASVLVFTQSTSLAHRLGARVLTLENGTVEETHTKTHTHHPTPKHVAAEAPAPEYSPEEKPATHAAHHHNKKEPAHQRTKGKIKITSIGS